MNTSKLKMHPINRLWSLIEEYDAKQPRAEKTIAIFPGSPHVTKVARHVAARDAELAPRILRALEILYLDDQVQVLFK